MTKQHEIFDTDLDERTLSALLKLKQTSPEQWQVFTERWLAQQQIHDFLTQQAKPIASYSKQLDDTSFFTNLQFKLDQLEVKPPAQPHSSTSPSWLATWLMSLTQPLRLTVATFVLLFLTVSVYFLIPEANQPFDNLELVRSLGRNNQNIQLANYREAVDHYQIDEYFLAHAMATGHPQSTIRAVSFNPVEGR